MESHQVLGDSMATRQCPFCEKFLCYRPTQCWYCREALPEVPVTRRRPTGERGEIRQGLLYMLLATTTFYFASGYSAMQLPFPIHPVVTLNLLPFLFLCGLGLTLHGFYLYRKV